MSRIELASSRVARLPIRILLALAPALLVLGSLNAAVQPARPQAPAACVPSNAVGGLLYQDYNATGDRQTTTPNEQAVTGIVVTAIDANSVTTSTTTAADGSWSIPVADGTNVRIEFSVPISRYLSGPHGSASDTTVTFVTSPNCAVDLGVNKPGNYCQSNPDLATSCYTFGEQLTQTAPVLIGFPYTAGSNTTDPLLFGDYSVPTPTHLADANQIGTTYGQAYQGASDSLFVAAFMKRHSGFGPNAAGTGATTGGIYRVDLNQSPPTTGVGLFLDLNVVLGAGTAGADPHPPGTDFEFDSVAWDPVGKTGLGDMDISEDQRTLWLINLSDRQLYEIPIGYPPAAPTAGQINRFPMPDPGVGATGCPLDPATPGGELNLDVRPFATAFHDGLVYVGMVCTAQSSQVTSTLRAFVYSFDPGTDAFSASPVLNVPLNYPRACAVRSLSAGTCADAEWRPWTTAFTVVNTPFSLFTREFINPQPWLVDIVFDGEDMILGVRDRFGDQMGYNRHATNIADSNLYTGDGAGDTLRACWDGTAWNLESNASCGGVGPTNPTTGTGPGVPGGEYYFTEDYSFHDETSVAGLAQIPGYPDVVETIYDPISTTDIVYAFDGGILWQDNATGARTRGYRVFDGGDPNPSFSGKSNGLGDLEVMCRVAPIEIGNRVWRDQDETLRNGEQDPTTMVSLVAAEVPIPGVTVHLYDFTEALIATTITDINGEYYFNATNVPGGLQPFMTYTIRLDNAADYQPFNALEGLTNTLTNNAGDTVDNDGVLCGSTCVEIVMATGDFGDNDHTFDFGFFDDLPPTAVELLYFRVDGVSGSQVDLAWATAVEVDTFGFRVYRAAENDFSRAQAVGFVPSAVKGSGSGAVYAYTDTVPSDGEWWYWLADVDTQGGQTVHGPVSASVSLNALLPHRIYLPSILSNQP